MPYALLSCCGMCSRQYQLVAEGLHYLWNKKQNGDGEYNSRSTCMCLHWVLWYLIRNPNMVKHDLHVWLISPSRVMQMILLFFEVIVWMREELKSYCNFQHINFKFLYGFSFEWYSLLNSPSNLIYMQQLPKYDK